MAKAVARLQPDDIESRPWSPVAGMPGNVEQRVLVEDPEIGAVARFLRANGPVEFDAELDPGLIQETYVLEGDISARGKLLGAHSYICQRPDDAGEAWSSGSGFLAFQTQDADIVTKPSAILTASEVEAIDWVPEDEFVKTKTLAMGGCGSDTSYYKISPDSPIEAEQQHECTEEVLFLSGMCHEGPEPNPPGMYTSFPPRTVHGPYTFQEELLIIEFKNYGLSIQRGEG